QYSRTFAQDPALPGEGVRVCPQIIGDGSARVDQSEKEAARAAEAEQVLKIVAQHRERIQQAVEQNEEYRVAVLVRARQHLAHIVNLLREQDIPYRAVELEKLSERQELIDLMSLVRALLHPMDRVAWLSVLRAPWCGLTLATRFEGLHATSFSQWIERTWRSLGGPQCVDAAAYENAQVFFAMLDAV